ncbi:MAG: c-type cytochrome [Verrucomicrobiales bacterium]|nr:c-type cytochrome [Verrucomicrobiales bacterium]
MLRHPAIRLAAALCGVVLLPTAAPAQRDLKDIPDPSPDLEKQALQLAPNLEINLWASDPMIAKPIQMAWDAKGRLWVASSAIYPHIKPGAKPDDAIVVLEDVNGDGAADKRTVFCEGLLIPTGVWPVIDAALPAGHPGRYNSAYVANSTEILLLRDTDGDGRADDRQIVMSGFGTEDTHHIIHSFKGGPDGCLYFNQSVYIHSHIETPYGTRKLLGSGIWQFQPETGQLEVFTMGQVNPWGHVWDRWGQSFTTDGAYGEGINYAFPGATFLCLPNQRPRILKGLNPGQPKQCGLEIVSGSHFPDAWQGTLITNDFRGHRVNRFAVSDDGSGFASRQMEDVVATTHQAFRPIDVRMGPDGALYIADWYNPIIQHGEVDFRDERRDHSHGRIWRITCKGRPLCQRPNYENAGIDALVELLNAREDWVRLWAKWELRTRQGREQTHAALAKALVGATDDHFRLELLWAMQTLNVQVEATAAAARTLAKSPSFEVRAAATRYLNFLIDRLKPTGDAASMTRHAPGEVSDAHPRVRLETVNALRTVGTAQAVELAMTALDKPVDANLDFALWLTAWELADVWLPALQRGEISFGGNVSHLSFALKAANRPEAAGALVKLVRENRVSGERAGEVLKLIAELGTAEDLALLLELSADRKTLSEAQRAAVFEALTTAARTRNLKPTGELNRVETILSSGPAGLRPAVARLAGAWKLESARAMLDQLALGADTGAELRQAAFAGLASLGGSAAVQSLTSAAGTGPAASRAQAAAALIALAPDQAAGVAVEVLAAMKEDAAGAGEVFDALLKLKNGPALLARSLKGRTLSAPVATLGLQKASQTGGDTKALQDALSAAGGLQPMVQQLTPDQMTALMNEVKASGNAARGEAVYRRQNLTCQVCHAIGGAGGNIGPDLVSIGASAPVDYIVESLLEPGKKIKEGFATSVVTTKTNEVMTGFLAAQDDQKITLRDAAGKTSVLARADIAKLENAPVSLMPPGLAASLRRDEFVDLVRFLSELGKEGDFKTRGEGVVRRWRVLQYSKALDAPLNQDGFRALTKPDPGFIWTPAYSLVNGNLPSDAIPKLTVFVHHPAAAQAEVDVTTAGKLGLRFQDATGVKVWLGDQELPIANNEAVGEVPVGRIGVTVVSDHSVRKAPWLRLELFDVPGSGIKARPVGGP